MLAIQLVVQISPRRFLFADSHYAIICFSKGEPRSLPGLEADFLSADAGKNSLPMEEFFAFAPVASIHATS
jgi:hypothetical protein